jgi:uncharacterized 2Fe-2S/4Fe-4S cluster protein (DUF4445 family)
LIDWSKELILSTKNNFREHYGAELTTEDAVESLNNLTGYFELLIKWDRKENQKQKLYSIT